MLGLKATTQAVTESADAVRDLAESAKQELSETSSLLRSTAQYLPFVVVGIGVVAIVALVVALVAVSRD